MKKTAAVSLVCCAAAGIAAWQVVSLAGAKARAKSEEVSSSAKIKDGDLGRWIEDSRLAARRKSPETALAMLNRLRVEDLPQHHRGPWYAAKAECLRLQSERCTDPQERDALANAALSTIELARHEGLPRAAEETERSASVRLQMSTGSWNEAIKQLGELEQLALTAEKRWSLRTMQADCLAKLGRLAAAATLLGSIAEEASHGDDPRSIELWADTLVRKAELHAAAAEGETAPKDSTPEAFRRNQLALCEAECRALMNNLPGDASQRLRGETLLLRLLCERGEVTESYDIANHLRDVAKSASYGAESLVHLARLEESRGNIKTAREYLTMCVTDYPEHDFVKVAELRHYQLLINRGLWNEALDIGWVICRGPLHDPRRLDILKSLLPDERCLTAHLNLAAKDAEAPKRREKIEEMLLSIEKDGDSRDSDFMESLHVARSMFALECEQWQDADRLCARYLANPSWRKYVERIQRLYVESSVRAGASPAVRAVRAKIYINSSFDETRTSEVIIILLNAFAEMELWAECVDTAKKVMKKQFSQLGKVQAGADQNSVMAIAILAHAYEKTGESAASNQLFSIWKSQFVAHPMAFDIYHKWAAAAAARGQHAEAVRRLNVAAPYFTRSADRVRLRAFRAAQNLFKPGPEAEASALASLAEIPAVLPGEEQQRWMQPIYAGLFNHLARTDRAAGRRLAAEAVRRFPSEIWPRSALLAFSDIGDGDFDAASTQIAEITPGTPLASDPDEALKKLLTRQQRSINATAALTRQAEEESKRRTP
ncbi:MAG: hypothetical protein RL095_2891 [Verrucomicrobiota bacterium]|jgi:hypothetical protein